MASVGLKRAEQPLAHTERLVQAGSVTDGVWSALDLPQLEERPRRLMLAVSLLVALGLVLLLLQWYAG